MLTPKYKIGDKAYKGFLTSDPPDCPTCHQPNYGDDADMRWKVSVQESTIIGIMIREGIRECEDGVYYQLDTEHWVLAEDDFHATHAEALEAINKYKEESRERARETHKELEEYSRSKGSAG